MLQVTLLVSIPLLLSLLLSVRATRRLKRDELLGISPRLVQSFTISRALYWWSFGILIFAFAMGLIVTGSGGEATRTMLLLSNTPTLHDSWLRPISDLLEIWRFAIVAFSLVSILAAIAALFLMGRKALNQMPEDKEPSQEFLRARARFFFLGMTLIAPPFLLSILLSI